MTKKVKGMVQLDGVTYRIVRVDAGTYGVVRIADDIEVGTFNTAPTFSVAPRSIDPSLLREIARVAIHSAKTSYVGLPAPVAPVAPEPAKTAPEQPGSMPPPLPAT